MAAYSERQGGESLPNCWDRARLRLGEEATESKRGPVALLEVHWDYPDEGMVTHSDICPTTPAMHLFRYVVATGTLIAL